MDLLIFIKCLSFLLFVILLIYFSFLMAKKRINGLNKNGGSKIQIIEHKRLEQKLTVTLITVGTERLILAANQNAIAFEKLLPATYDDLGNKKE